MHIKQVVIRGFKTYKDQTSLTEDFHAGVNAVVGFNGSGKSNFFNAILFVLSNNYGTLRAETRKALLHEGAGPAVLTAFVEIVFDNQDRRMPIDKEEVRIRRAIGVKKDDFILDGKHATKTEVFNFLESCGFTKSNPYYIVQQGKISELTLMTDRQRLELIKEVSGASVYDERRAESEKILEEVTIRRQKSDDVLEVITQRIHHLEEEQRELVEYQKFERQRRCLEFELTDRDWRTSQDRIDALEAEHRDAGAVLSSAQRAAQGAREAHANAEGDVQQEETARLKLTSARDEAEGARIARLSELTHARLKLDDERKSSGAVAKSRAETTAEVQRLEAEVRMAEEQLAVQRPRLETADGEKRELALRRQRCEAQRDQLLAKQGRRSQYSSIQERNFALEQEVARRRKRREEMEKTLSSCETQITLLQKRAQDARKTAERQRDELVRVENELNSVLGPNLAGIGTELEHSAEQRRLLNQQRERTSREKEEHERQVTQNNYKIDATMPRAQRNALSEVRRWVDRQGVGNLVYGTLLENMQVPPTYHIAVEGTAGLALFNLLVKDDDIGAQIISFVRKGNLGSVTCTPLNQICARPRDYPKLAGVKPLVDVVTCPGWAMPAIHQVFGRTVVCQTLELCDEVSRVHGLDAITLDGDKVSSKGTMTGGYQDPSRFIRLKCVEQMRLARDAAAELAPKLEELDRRNKDMAMAHEALHAKRSGWQEDRVQFRSKLAHSNEAAQEAQRQAVRHDEVVGRHRERSDEIRSGIAEGEVAIEALGVEMKSKTLGELSQEELRLLSNFSEELKEVAAKLETSEECCHQLQREIRGHEQRLNERLQKRLNELRTELFRDTQQDHAELVLSCTKAVERLEREHQEAELALQTFQASLQERDSALTKKKDELENLQTEVQKSQGDAEHCVVRLDELTLKITNLVKKKTDADDKMRTLTIGSTDMAKYKAMTAAQLTKEIAIVNKALTKFEHVNKKAMDQYTTFMDQLHELQRKRKEIDESRESIENLIARVDEHRDENLLQTLQRIDEHFREIFSELVRGGVGKLCMLQRATEMDEDEPPLEGHVLEKMRGVRIEVSFTGQSTSFLTMAQLSGGQKTVVAIALIFSIQRLEPAPFYLFDEIDAALDTQYRTSVARLIEKDAKSAQMVITTFRPEIIGKADRCYRVYQKNRVSRIECVPMLEAKRVIEEQKHLEKIED